jgi:hypothetical protein
MSSKLDKVTLGTVLDCHWQPAQIFHRIFCRALLHGILHHREFCRRGYCRSVLCRRVYRRNVYHCSVYHRSRGLWCRVFHRIFHCRDCVGCVTVVGYCLVVHQKVLYCRGRVLVRGTCTGSGQPGSSHITGLGIGRLLVSGKVGHGTVLGRSNRSGVFHLGWCCVEQSWGAGQRKTLPVSTRTSSKRKFRVAHKQQQHQC